MPLSAAAPSPESTLPAPAPGTVREVAPGILWIRMPLPFALDHVNLWAVEDGDGWALVDTGVGDDATRALWERLLAGPLAGRPITRLICTHFHPDHMGLAGWLTERTGVALTATRGEWSFGRMLWLEDEGAAFLAHKREHYRRAGWAPSLLEHVRAEGNSYRPRVVPPPTWVRAIGDGETLCLGGRDWVVLVCGGHSPEHACLWCPEAGVLIAGDQVLPRISPLIGVWNQEPEGDPLAHFLASLDRLGSLSGDPLVLPSHDHPFRGLARRCGELAEHHRRRLAKTLEACAAPATAWEVCQVLFRRRMEPRQLAFATGETLAHLNHAIALGLLGRETRDDGVWAYRRI